eukprot:10847899-Heterocapsa_arctica.AAC.1
MELYAWVDQRVACALAFVEKQVKGIVLKTYISAGGRFDVEAFKIDFTKFVSDKRALDGVVGGMGGLRMNE